MIVTDIQVIVRTGSVLRGLQALARMDNAKVFRRCRPLVRADQRQHAAKQEGPDGAWPPLASSTKERRARMAKLGKTSKRKASSRMLGRLPGANRMDINRSRLRDMSRVRWSMIHQEGGIAGHGARIPRRTFKWVSEPLQKKVCIEFERELNIIWSRMS